MFTSSFGSWLSRPFVAYKGHGEGSKAGTPRAGESMGEDFAPFGENSTGSEKTNASGDVSEERGSAENPEAAGGENRHGQQPFSLIRLLSLIAAYFSIFFVIGKGVHILDKIRSAGGSHAPVRNR